MTATKNDVTESEKTVDYKGELDENRMRKGHGREVHRRKPGNEFYKGNFKNDAYHGLGYYKKDSVFDNEWTYEGSFFSNAKEGYGLLSLPDNAYFEGLYENDRPFGPGVLTRSNGEQDVGFWQSSSIIRLIEPIPSEVQELSATPTIKVFMAKYKNLVEVAPPNTVSLQIAKGTNLPEELAPKLYSMYCKDPRNFLFNYEQFEQEYFGDLRKMEDLLPTLSDDDFSIGAEMKDVQHTEQTKDGDGEFTDWSHGWARQTLTNEKHEITESNMSLCWDRLRKRINLLVAWNNTPIIIDIMVHTFINRIYEKMAGFKVVDIVCNNRQPFGKPGPLEQACQGLLESSNSGNLRDFTWLLFANRLNINVQDSRGNGCVIRAAAQDHHALLYLLFLYGADMNTENDEGFTALNHTITRYLSMLYTVEDWSKAFLPPSAAKSEPVKSRIWRKCRDETPKEEKPKEKSYVKPTKFVADIHREQKSLYIFNLSPTEKPSQPRRKKTLPKNVVHQRVTSQRKLGRKMESEIQYPEADALLNQKLENVRLTLELLLTFKINPNISRLPQPAIILAIFTGDYGLVKMLLEAGVDPNARFLPEEGWLTPLHILCLAKPQQTFPKIMDILLEYGADPNAATVVEFAPKTKEFVLQGNSETDFPVVGLTPLQALLLRADGSYVPGKEILKELLLKLHDISTKNPRYFGHSFLSMAVIRMNLAFIFTLLHIFGDDPNEQLHPYWGNVATAYLKYLGKVKEPEAIITLIELEQAGLNPLRTVESWETNEEENAINVAFRMGNFADLSSRRKTVDDKESILSSKRSNDIPNVPKKANQRKSKSSRRKSDDYPNVLTSNKRGNSGKSSATLRESSRGSKSAVLSRGSNRKIDKELLKKITLLQDLGRDKVDKYIRGLVIRRLITYLRKKINEGGVINKNDNQIQQAINWFCTTNLEEELIRILTHNILAGLTFLSSQEAEETFSIMPWERKEPPFSSTRKATDHQDSLKSTDKVSLNQLKEAIKTQLNDGVSINNINLDKKKLREKSAASPKIRSDSHGSAISIKSKNRSSIAPDRQGIIADHKSTVKPSNESLKMENQAAGVMDNDVGNQSREKAEKNELLAQGMVSARKAEFIQKLQPLLLMCSPQVRWAKSYGTKSVRMPKRAKFRTDMYPEVDKNPALYRVCYKCVKRDISLQLCPVCKIVWYCSSKCNTRDVMNPNSNHRCKADFYGRGIMWRHYGIDENGNIYRISREGQEDWEGEDMANDALVKKYGKKLIMADDNSRRKKYPNALIGGNESPGGVLYTDKQGNVNRDKYGNVITDKYGNVSTDKFGNVITDKYGNVITGDQGRMEKMYGSGRAGYNRGIGDLGGAAKFQEGKLKKESKLAAEKAKARLKEKKALHLREAKMMRVLRKKIPHGVMGDFMKWGFNAIESLKDKLWYKKQKEKDQGDTYGNLEEDDAQGAVLSPQYLQLGHQLKVLQGLASLLGSKFDLNTLSPWVVLRDGELYYKFNSTSFVLENFSFN